MAGRRVYNLAFAHNSKFAAVMKCRKNRPGMSLFVLGINHQTAPLAIREKVAFPTDTLGRTLRALTGLPGVDEAAILSTCNRTEIYASTGDADALADWLAGMHRSSSADLQAYLYRRSEQEAVKHAFRVASGLDSMVLGEPQILGQMKQAVRIAEQEGTLGPLLNQVFQRTFSVAKEVRSSTEIGANSVSMAAAAVRVAQNIFGDLSKQRVLFIGAGEMIELAATHFAAQKPKHITVANRTLEKAKELAARFQGQAIILAELPDHIASFDIVVTSTASQLPILGKGLIERAIKARKHRPVFMVDLAVPRDVEAEVAQLSDVFLYTVDDLANIVAEGRELRSQAVGEAEAIIASRLSEFVHWQDGRTVVPTIRLIRDRADEYRSAELLRAQRALAKGEDPAKVLESFSRALLNKFLHHPTAALNEAAPEERAELARLLNRLYRPPDKGE
jgi:glutamyl-tRNA reductase